MSRSNNDTTKLISVQTVVSSFVGIMAAVPLAFAVVSPMNASAETSTADVSVGDFEKFAYAFSQGYQANLANATVEAGPMGCSEDVAVKAAAESSGAGGAAGVQVMGAGVQAKTWGSNGGGQKYGGSGAEKKLASAMARSYSNYYHNTVHNSSSVSNVNSNNNVGSHNKTSTEIEVEDSKNVILGVSNDPKVTQMNANESFNEDSYNTKTETEVINTNNSNNTTKTNTTNMDIEVEEETNVSNIVNSNNTSTTNSHNELEVEVDAEIDYKSHNEYDD